MIITRLVRQRRGHRRPFQPAPRAAALLVALVGVLITADSARAEPVVLRVDPARSTLVAHLLKEGAGARFAHDHVIRARRVDGQLAIDPASPAGSRLRLTVDARALEADSPELRRRYGLAAIGDGDRRKIEENMRGPGQLHVAAHPTITFASTTITPRGADSYQLAGRLTIRGVTRAVQAVVRARYADGVLRASTQLRFKQRDFGYQPYRAMLGLVRVRDEATLDVYLEARRPR